MSTLSLCRQKYPQVKFTGGSEIHASIYREGLVKTTMAPHQIMGRLKETNYASKVLDFLTAKFPSFVWGIDPVIFNGLAYVEINHYLEGLGPLITPGQIVNPVTGNHFHRVGMDGNLVGSIRFWAERPSPWDNPEEGIVDGWLIGFRFRLVEVNDIPEALKELEKEEELRCPMICEEHNALWDILEALPEVEKAKAKSINVVQLLEVLD